MIKHLLNQDKDETNSAITNPLYWSQVGINTFNLLLIRTKEYHAEIEAIIININAITRVLFIIILYCRSVYKYFYIYIINLEELSNT